MDRRKNKIDKTLFKRWMKKQSNVEHVGKVAIFYLPEEKLTKNVRDKLHEFDGASCDTKPGEGDGCRLWYVNPWAL